MATTSAVESPLFSIVTVVLNGGGVIEQTIKSVQFQGRNDVEYVVIDGGSADETLEVLDRHRATLARVVSEPDRGIYDAFNKGIRLVRGRYVLLLNAGDRLAPGALDHVAAAYAQLDDIDAVLCGAVEKLDGEEKTVTVVSRGDADLGRRHLYMFLNHPALFVPRMVYERVGLYDHTYRIAGDYEFAQRLVENGIPIRFTDRIVTIMNAGGVSAGFSWRQAREFFRVVRKYAGLPHAVLSAGRFVLGTTTHPLRERLRAPIR